MTVLLSDVGRRGRIELAFSLQEGRTVLRDAYYEVPFKITRVLNTHAPAAHLILMQCTAGLFGGDTVECSIRVERGARVRITQQSATKVHPSQDRVAVQIHRVHVADGAELHLYMEPVIPFANSRLQQETTLAVEPGGSLCYWEAFMAGRMGRGEFFQFAELASQTQLRLGERLVYLDRFHLRADSRPESPWAMAGNGYMGTGLYVGDRTDRLAPDLHADLPNAGIDSPDAGVVAVRVIDANGPGFHRSREAFCRHAEGVARGSGGSVELEQQVQEHQ